MEIIIKPKPIVCQNNWDSKAQSVILVENESDIEPLFNSLLEQDEYWKTYKNLIKVSPKEIESEDDLKRMCGWCGKTDIYDVEQLKKDSGIDFIIFQYFEHDND